MISRMQRDALEELRDAIASSGSIIVGDSGEQGFDGGYNALKVETARRGRAVVDISDEVLEMHPAERARLLNMLKGALESDTAVRGRRIQLSTTGLVDSRNVRSW